MSKTNYDFGGYVTKYNVKCGDGRTILKDAFKDADGMKVPMVWQHMHQEPTNVLGHMLLESRDDGIYAYCKCNETESGKNAKILVEHKDITSLSVYANNLIEKSKNVIHGVIREGSLVLAGSNPGAKIDFISIEHSDGMLIQSEDEAIIYSGIEFETESEETVEEIKHESTEKPEETVEEIFNSLSDKQKDAVYAIIGGILSEEESSDNTAAQSDIQIIKDEGDNKVMKHNVFDGSAINKERPHLTHAQFSEVMETARKIGSLKEALLSHAGTYGIDNIDVLFPDAQSVMNEPVLYSRDMEWVPTVINGTRHSPFSRIKSSYADITVETARALGYVTGALKKEEVFALLTRTTTPYTIYKKQKLDRDDMVDITDLDVVVWLKREMRMMLDEEIARAVLISDGRDPVSEAADKIVETNIRPIWKDADMYAHKVQSASDATTDEILDSFITGRVNYKGSGSPVAYMAPSFLTSALLMKDTLGYRIYKTETELAAALRVSRIIEVPLMENLVREAGTTDYDLIAIVVNLKDYVLGADKGGQVSMFDDFDIDYNQYKYLMETRVSGALVQPKSALIIEKAHVEA